MKLFPVLSVIVLVVATTAEPTRSPWDPAPGCPWVEHFAHNFQLATLVLQKATFDFPDDLDHQYVTDYVHHHVGVVLTHVRSCREYAKERCNDLNDHYLGVLEQMLTFAVNYSFEDIEKLLSDYQDFRFGSGMILGAVKDFVRNCTAQI